MQVNILSLGLKKNPCAFRVYIQKDNLIDLKRVYWNTLINFTMVNGIIILFTMYINMGL